MSSLKNILAVTFFVTFLAISPAAYAQDATLASTLKAASGNDQTCAETALSLAKTQADLAADSAEKQAAVARVAGIAGAQCSQTAIASIATTLAKEFSSDAVAIAVAMVKSDVTAVAEIVLSIVTAFPPKRQQKKFDDILAALKQHVPELANQDSFSALSIPGAPPSPSFSAPNAGLLAFDVISPS
jgi:hypothetical protein